MIIYMEGTLKNLLWKSLENAKILSDLWTRDRGSICWIGDAYEVQVLHFLMKKVV